MTSHLHTCLLSYDFALMDDLPGMDCLHYTLHSHQQGMNIMKIACSYADNQKDGMRLQSNMQVEIGTQKGGRRAVVHQIVLHE